jgi:hypothetical protein
MNHQLPGIQVSRILIKLTQILKEIYHFYNAIQKQIYNLCSPTTWHLSKPQFPDTGCYSRD